MGLVHGPQRFNVLLKWLRLQQSRIKNPRIIAIQGRARAATFAFAVHVRWIHSWSLADFAKRQVFSENAKGRPVREVNWIVRLFAA